MMGMIRVHSRPAPPSMTDPRAAPGFAFAREQFQQMVDDTLAEARRLGASDAGVEVSEGIGLSVSVRMGELENVERNRDKSLGVTVYLGQRRGNASTSDFSPAAVRQTVQAAYDIARFTAEDPAAGLPDADDLAKKDATELRWSYDPDGCCEIRKVKPLEKALADFDTSITGRKGFQAATRTGLPRFELDGTTGRLKFNPLANWTREDLDAYFAAHDLPRHPLEAQGYPSIGCSPCTSKVRPGEDPRSGRWRGWDKTECGIHDAVSPIGEDPANDPAF